MSAAEDDARQWALLVVLHSRVEQRLGDALQRRHSVGLSECRALCLLKDAAAGELRMQEPADAIGLNQSSVSRLAGRLETADLTRRSHCDQDRRGVYTEITDAGRRLHAAAKPTYTAALPEALDEAAATRRSTRWSHSCGHGAEASLSCAGTWHAQPEPRARRSAQKDCVCGGSGRRRRLVVAVVHPAVQAVAGTFGGRAVGVSMSRHRQFFAGFSPGLGDEPDQCV